MADILQNSMTTVPTIDFTADVTRGTNSITPTFTPIEVTGITLNDTMTGTDIIENELG